VPSLWLVIVISWIAQDLLRALITPFMAVPDMYILALGMLFTKESYNEVLILVAAFIGGLLWDARWGAPLGFTSMLYVGCLIVLKIAWGAVSHAAKTPAVAFFLVFSVHLCASLIELILYRNTVLFPGFSFIAKQIGALIFCLLVHAHLLREEMD
jgi:cell shape-determining protein MreD